MPAIVRVENLSLLVGDGELAQMFQPFGAVRRAQLAPASDKRCSTAEAEVEMRSDEGADAAVAGLNGRDYRGNFLRVRRAAAREFEFGDVAASGFAGVPDRAAPLPAGPLRGEFGDRGGSRRNGG